MVDNPLSKEELLDALEYLTKTKRVALERNINSYYAYYIDDYNTGLCPTPDIRYKIGEDVGEDDFGPCNLGCNKCWEICITYWESKFIKYWDL